MTEYHKIQTVYHRDPATRHRTLLEGVWSMPEFEYLAACEWVWTEKIDGTNIRVTYEPGSVEFGGRTDDAQIPPFLVKRLSETFPCALLEQTFAAGGEPITLYGEGYGAKVQKGGRSYIPDGCGFILFDVRVGSLWLRRDAVVEIAGKLGIAVVPEIGRGPLLGAVDLARARFPSVVAQGRCTAEGLVMRPSVELLDRRGQRVIAKIKCRDFA